MRMEKISVIVPIYNSSRYLEECLDSLCSQDYPNLEILLIDDGSEDESLRICMNRAAKDPRCIVIHQENQGLSAARNTGLDHARGEYVMFLDSDDQMLPGMIRWLYELLQKSGTDIAQCGYMEYDEETSKYYFYSEPKLEPGQYLIYEKDQLFKMIMHLYPISVVQWNKLFKRSLFAQIRFPAGKYHEDEFVIHWEMDAARSLAHTPEMLYLYRRHKDSITGNGTMEKRYHIAQAWYEMALFMKERRMYDNIPILQRKLLRLINDSVQNAEEYSDIEQFLPCVMEIFDKMRRLV